MGAYTLADSTAAADLSPIPVFTDEIGVTLVESAGTDLSVVNAARVSLAQHSEEFGPSEEGLLRFLMKNRHASPFEHVWATFKIDAPIFVAREWMRHRTQSFNEVSGRYSELEPKFYMPAVGVRPIQQIGKPGSYQFRPGVQEQRDTVVDEFENVMAACWESYDLMLKRGIAKEVARMVLPVGIYTSFFASANLRNWLNFLALRMDDNAMFEIRAAAHKIFVHLMDVAPVSVELWDEYGRNSI